MQGHFLEHLKVKDLLLSHPPAHILELGALEAWNTVQLLSLRADIPGLRVTTVTDDIPTKTKPSDPYLTWIWGVSWIEMERMPDKSFGAVIIDTDHNYYTLNRELGHCDRLLADPGWIMMHDTVTYGTVNGKFGYAHTEPTSNKFFRCGVPYPIEAIEAEEAKGKGMLDAIREFLDAHPAFAVVRESREHHGAMALRRVSCA